MLYPVNGRTPHMWQCNILQHSNKPEQIRAVVTKKTMLRACKLPSTFKQWWNLEWTWTMINYRKTKARFTKVAVQGCATQVLTAFILRQGNASSWKPFLSPTTAALHQCEPPAWLCTSYSEAALQGTRGALNIHIPFSAGAAEGAALLVFVWKALFGDQTVSCQ